MSCVLFCLLMCLYVWIVSGVLNLFLCVCVFLNTRHTLVFLSASSVSLVGVSAP